MRSVSSYEAYAKVNNPHDDVTDDDESEDNNHKTDNQKQCNAVGIWLYEYIESQTRLPSLILYIYLFWFLFIMFAFGIKNMPTTAWMTACVLATFVFIALNAAAYHPPACGIKGYFRNYFKLLRFWLIPFCVSSLSVACNASPNECKLLFPTDDILLTIHLGAMVGILCIGSIIHSIILPKLKCYAKKQENDVIDEECGGNRNQSKHKRNGSIEVENKSVAEMECDVQTDTLYVAIPLTQNSIHHDL